MGKFGWRVVGENVFMKRPRSIIYHYADKNGRMYLCRCMPMFRAGERLLFPNVHRMRKSKMQSARYWRGK